MFHTLKFKTIKTIKTRTLTIIAIVFFVGNSFSQSSSKIPLIGSKAPSFTAKSTNGELKFPNDFGKSWKILFSHPQDFTPVCSSELIELAHLQGEFGKLNVKLAIISTDDIETHKLWKAHLEEIDYQGRGAQKINFPIFEDQSKTSSRLYGMLHEPTSSNKDIRGVFIIDSENIVRSMNFYPMQVGRNLNELVRLVEALQTVDHEKVLTPANWEKGGDVMVPYFPYTLEQLAAKPELKDEYYNMGNRMWFKKADK